MAFTDAGPGMSLPQWTIDNAGGKSDAWRYKPE
jgi:hypothetical protein